MGTVKLLADKVRFDFFSTYIYDSRNFDIRVCTLPTLISLVHSGSSSFFVFVCLFPSSLISQNISSCTLYISSIERYLVDIKSAYL